MENIIINQIYVPDIRVVGYSKERKEAYVVETYVDGRQIITPVKLTKERITR